MSAQTLSSAGGQAKRGLVSYGKVVKQLVFAIDISGKAWLNMQLKVLTGKMVS